MLRMGMQRGRVVVVMRRSDKAVGGALDTRTGLDKQRRETYT